MGLSLYDLSVPIYIRSLQNLIIVLKAGEKWASENNVDADSLLEARIHSDMNPLKFQIQTASNTSKSILTRVAGQENVSMDDNETTYQQLIERVEKTVDALKGAKEENFAGKEDMEVSLFNGKIKFSGLTYLQFFGLPNFFFHVTTAYDILRKEGVPVGKMDFLGRSA